MERSPSEPTIESVPEDDLREGDEGYIEMEKQTNLNKQKGDYYV